MKIRTCTTPTGRPDAARRAFAFRRFPGLVACLLAGLVAGCQVAKETAKLPVGVVNAFVPGSGRSVPVDPVALQAQVLRFADDFSSRNVTALDDYLRRVDDPAMRRSGLVWKVSLHSSAMGIATGQNPTANLLDFVALATLTRTFLEELGLRARPPGVADAWIATSRQLETNAWALAQQVLTPNQAEEIRTALAQWSVKTHVDSAAFFERPQEFAALVRRGGEERASAPGSVFSLVGLDPTAGLDPAVREATALRLFAERALFAAERIPLLVRWQTEVLAERVLNQDQVGAALRSADRLSQAAESASRTAATLPDRVTAERQALLAALEAQEGRLRELSAEVTRTLAAGTQMSTSLNTTLTTFDRLMKRFGVGEPDTAPRDTNSPPFRILDYAQTADRIAAMAAQLDALIKNTTGTLETPALDRRIADLNALSARARADANAVLNHAFLLAAALVALFFVGLIVARRLGGPR